MKILYGTSNPAKLAFMQKSLMEFDLDIIGLKDISGEIPIAPEDGSSPMENARQKAWCYHKAFNIPVFSCDSGLYFEDIDNELQPGVHVRNVNGKTLSDDEMLLYYGGLAKKYGDLTARYMNAICMIIDSEHIYESMDTSLAGEKFIITSKPHKKTVKGFPLDSLSKHIATGKYYYDLDEACYDVDEYSGFVQFFKEYLV